MNQLPIARWRAALGPYADPRVMLILPLGFASGLPLLLTFSTLSAWLAEAGVGRAAIGAFALVGAPYSLKFLWAPLLDHLPPPLPLGRRRGWGIAIQLALIAAVLALGRCDPHGHLVAMGALALLVAFLSASQDVVIDAFRVESLETDQQGPGAGMIQTGYRLAMLTAGAGALMIAEYAGWFPAYAAMAALLSVGLITFLLAPEPSPAADTGASRPGDLRKSPERSESASGVDGPTRSDLRAWLATSVIGPFADFMRRPYWLVILIFIFAYKLGEALAGVMAMPLYITLHFSLGEIAAMSKLVGFVATIVGALVGGIVTARLGVFRALLLCGILQSAGNLFYVLQAVGGHRLDYLALCVAAENLTSAMAGAALIAYLSDLCSPAYTATQYALLSSLAAVGRTIVAAWAGVLADAMGWAHFFLLTTIVTIPALLILVWLSRRTPFVADSALAAASGS